MLKARRQLPFTRGSKAVVVDVPEPRYSLTLEPSSTGSRPGPNNKSAFFRVMLHGVTDLDAARFGRMVAVEFCVSAKNHELQSRFEESLRSPVQNYMTSTALWPSGTLYQAAIDAEHALSPETIESTVAYAHRHGSELEFGYVSSSPYLLGEVSDEATLRRVKVEKLLEDGFLGRGTDGLKRYRYPSVKSALALRGTKASGESFVISFLVWGDQRTSRNYFFGASKVCRLGDPLIYRAVGAHRMDSFDIPRTPKNFQETIFREEMERIREEELEKLRWQQQAEERARYRDLIGSLSLPREDPLASLKKADENAVLARWLAHHGQKGYNNLRNDYEDFYEDRWN